MITKCHVIKKKKQVSSTEEQRWEEGVMIHLFPIEYRISERTVGVRGWTVIKEKGVSKSTHHNTAPWQVGASCMNFRWGFVDASI